MNLCEKCKNMLCYEEEKVYPKTTIYRCIFGLLDLDHISKCSHFEEKPKSNSKHFKEAKQNANIGKQPRRQPRVKCKLCGKKVDWNKVHVCNTS